MNTSAPNADTLQHPASAVPLDEQEVPPPEVARILDHLDRRFFELFHNVE